MSDTPIPSLDELVEVGARAAWSDPGSYGDERAEWDDLIPLLGPEGQDAQDTFRSQTRAILTAVLPLVLREPMEALGQALRQWKMYAEMYEMYEHGDEGDHRIDTAASPEAELYRRAAAVRDQIAALIDG